MAIALVGVEGYGINVSLMNLCFRSCLLVEVLCIVTTRIKEGRSWERFA
jgi:hypothetical protein